MGEKAAPLHNGLLSGGIRLANNDCHMDGDRGQRGISVIQGLQETISYTLMGPGTSAFIFLGLLWGMNYLLEHYSPLYFGFSVLKNDALAVGEGKCVHFLSVYHAESNTVLPKSNFLLSDFQWPCSFF